MKILVSRRVRVRLELLLLMLKLWYRSLMERLSICPLHGGDGLPVNLTENLEAEEEFSIITAKDNNAERKIAARCSDRAVTLIREENKKKKS